MNLIINYVILFLGVFALSASAIFVKLANAPSGITAFYRLLFATLILFPLVLIKKEKRQEIYKLTKKQIGMTIISGLILAIHYVLWFESLNYTSVASSIVIVALQPVFSMVFGYFLLQEKHHYIAILGCLIALFGSFIIGYGDFQTGATALFGDILALLAGAFVSLYFIIGQVSRKNISATVYSVLGYSASTVFLGLYAFIKGSPFTGYSIYTWQNFIGLAFVSTVLGQFVFNILLKRLPATTITMGILCEPIGTCILAYFILNEVINFQQGVGMFIILLGLSIFFLADSVTKK